MSETPPDPISATVANAIVLYDTFTGLQTAGFNEAQALYLVGMYLQGVAANRA